MTRTILFQPVKFATALAMLILALSFPGAAQDSATAGETPNSTGSDLRTMSFNIRYDNPGDSANAWPNRIRRVAGMFRFYEPDLVGVQEALKSQISSLRAEIPEYDWYGVGRDDGADGGEFCPIFYRRDRLELLEKATFWLSETPDTPGSRGWDAVCNRVVTWGKFRDKVSENEFYFFNTHFDHAGPKARLESAKLLRKKIGKIAGSGPVILAGDLNCRDTSAVYHILLAGPADGASPLQDAIARSITPHHGPTGTFHGFTGVTEPGGRIDYIFVTPSWVVHQHAILPDHWDGRYPSDHLPVLAVLRME